MSGFPAALCLGCFYIRQELSPSTKGSGCFTISSSRMVYGLASLAVMRVTPFELVDWFPIETELRGQLV